MLLLKVTAGCSASIMGRAPTRKEAVACQVSFTYTENVVVYRSVDNTVVSRGRHTPNSVSPRSSGSECVNSVFVVLYGALQPQIMRKCAQLSRKHTKRPHLGKEGHREAQRVSITALRTQGWTELSGQPLVCCFCLLRWYMSRSHCLVSLRLLTAK